jgi:hypothetical protein
MFLRGETSCTKAPCNSCESCPKGSNTCLFPFSRGTLSITVHLIDSEFCICARSAGILPCLQRLAVKSGGEAM